MKRTIFCILMLFLLPACFLRAASPIEPLLTKTDAWFASADGIETLDNVLAWQSEHGDWPKNVNTTVAPKLAAGKRITGTFDNGATTGEMRLLARAYLATDRALYREAFLRGLDHILRAQYPNGGWPQFYPLSSKYHRHITFNDHTMIRLMRFLQEVSSNVDFQFVDSERRESARDAVNRGVRCILACQVVVDDQLTVWCAQHDAETLAPTQARVYELASLSGAESAGILEFLMTIDEPSPAVIRAVRAGGRSMV
jgi:PelA/Pel-15E family pectate lyase